MRFLDAPPCSYLHTETGYTSKTQIIALYGGALDNDRRVSVGSACELGRLYHCQGITLSGLLSVALKTAQLLLVTQIAASNARHTLASTRATVRLAKYRRLSH